MHLNRIKNQDIVARASMNGILKINKCYTFCLLSFLALMVCYNTSKAFGQNALDELCDMAVKEAGPLLKKSDIPDNAKIAVLFLTFANNHNDTAKTLLGVELAKKLEQRMGLFIQEKKLPYKILASTAVSEKNMGRFFIPPDNSKDEEIFWKDFLESEKPDFYITGSYRIGHNFSTLELKNLKLLPNKYDTRFKNVSPIVIADQSIAITDNNEKQMLTKYIKPYDIAEYVNWLANTFAFQFNEKAELINLANFTYQDSRMGSQFSKKLSTMMEQELQQSGGLNITSKQYLPFDENKPYNYVLSGSYWEEGDFIKVIAGIRNEKTGKILLSAENTIPKSSIIKQGIALKPDNYDAASKTQQLFKTDELVEGSLEVELWANKGQENLIYSEGDSLYLYLRANNQCYVRIVYYLADGSKVLMLDNFFVSPDKVNKIIKLPDLFICAAPYGAETMVVNAQSKPFEPLGIKQEYGYSFILDDTKEIIVKTRGFIKDQSTNAMQKAEQRLVFTTLSR